MVYHGTVQSVQGYSSATFMNFHTPPKLKLLKGGVDHWVSFGMIVRYSKKRANLLHVRVPKFAARLCCSDH